jgi:hypothetical protein
MVRRLLLVLVTALIVARPLVLGEDPGLLNRLSSAWSLLLTQLWFVAAVGWAVWRAWSGQTRWRGSAVEAGLLALAALVWVSAEGVAHYKHPARLIAAEWLVLLCAFCLVRQLARTPEDNRGLLAALVASAVSISAFSLYQYAIIFPEIRNTYSDRDVLLEAMAAENVVANPELLEHRLFENNVFGTYSHPNCLAGYLALLLPVAIAWTSRAKGIRRKSSATFPFTFFLAASATLLVGLALWLTHSRGAILGSLVVGVIVLLAYGNGFLRAHKTATLTGVIVLCGTLALLLRTELAARGLAKFWESSAKRTDYWIATWSMIRDHPWLGVGPGNFGRVYPRYMLPRAFEQIKDPHNLILEMWSTSGVCAAIALLTTLGIFFRRTWPAFRGASTRMAGTGGERGSERAPAATAARWEFYVGGMLGLVVGFVFRAMDQSADEILLEGAYCFGRSLVWFGVFALFDRIPWSLASRPIALTAGVAALLLNLLVSGGIAMPSVAQPLWIVMALTLNSLDPETADASRSAKRLPRVLPLGILAGIGAAYFVLLFHPAIRCGGELSHARRSYAFWRSELLPRWRGIIDMDRRYIASIFASCNAGPLHPLAMLRLSQLGPQATLGAGSYLQTYILSRLERAVDADPANALAWLELAEWYGELCKVVPAPEVIRQAIHGAEQAKLLDPDNKDPYVFEHSLHTLIAEYFRQRERAEYGQAAVALRAAVERDPTNAGLRYQLAETLFLADLPVDGRRHARIAQELDEQATHPERALTPSQREQIRRWLSALKMLRGPIILSQSQKSRNCISEFSRPFHLPHRRIGSAEAANVPERMASHLLAENN